MELLSQENLTVRVLQIIILNNYIIIFVYKQKKKSIVLYLKERVNFSLVEILRDNSYVSGPLFGGMIAHGRKLKTSRAEGRRSLVNVVRVRERPADSM